MTDCVSFDTRDVPATHSTEIQCGVEFARVIPYQRRVGAVQMILVGFVIIANPAIVTGLVWVTVVIHALFTLALVPATASMC